MTTNSLATMSDRDLLDATARVVRDERRSTADLLALLGELDSRRLYLGEGCSSLFTYCTQVLHLSEHAAYHRIEAARAARQFPIIVGLVADGSVTLTTVALLRPHLTAENHESRSGSGAAQEQEGSRASDRGLCAEARCEDGDSAATCAERFRAGHAHGMRATVTTQPPAAHLCTRRKRCLARRAQTAHRVPGHRSVSVARNSQRRGASEPATRTGAHASCCT